MPDDFYFLGFKGATFAEGLFPPRLNRVLRLEDAVGRIVRCHDGTDRRIRSVDETHIGYALLIAGGAESVSWMELSLTRRSEIESDIVGARFITEELAGAAGRARAHTREELLARIDNYLQAGGLFNPECMEQDKVRTLLINCQTYLQNDHA